MYEHDECEMAGTPVLPPATASEPRRRSDVGLLSAEVLGDPSSACCPISGGPSVPPDRLAIRPRPTTTTSRSSAQTAAAAQTSLGSNGVALASSQGSPPFH